MVGPKAVRNICRRRPLASSAATTWTRSVIAVLLLWRLSVGLGGWLRRLCRGGLEGRIDACRGQKIRMLRDDGFQNLGDESLAAGELPANLRDEDLETLFPQQPSRLLNFSQQRRGSF